MKLYIVVVWLLCLVMAGCTGKEGQKMSDLAYIHSDDLVKVGRYLVVISGCNDCHTDGYLMTEGKVPEENWLTGSPVGWHGPWGTTYPQICVCVFRSGVKISG